MVDEAGVVGVAVSSSPDDTAVDGDVAVDIGVGVVASVLVTVLGEESDAMVGFLRGGGGGGGRREDGVVGEEETWETGGGGTGLSSMECLL